MRSTTFLRIFFANPQYAEYTISDGITAINNMGTGAFARLYALGDMACVCMTGRIPLGQRINEVARLPIEDGGNDYVMLKHLATSDKSRFLYGCVYVLVEFLALL
jgi:hypothetical protein